MQTSAPARLEIGKTYRNSDPNISPEWMANARITILRIAPDDGRSLNVGYSFVATNGQTGEGTMRQDHAEQFLVTA